MCSKNICEAIGCLNYWAVLYKLIWTAVSMGLHGHVQKDRRAQTCPSLLLSSHNRVRRPALRAPPPAKCANAVLGTRRHTNAARSCPSRRGRVPVLRSSRGARRDGRGALPQSGGQELVLLGWSSGSHQRPWGIHLRRTPRFIRSADPFPYMCDTSFGCLILLFASVLQFAAKFRTTSDCCCFMPLVTTEPKERQMLKS